MYGWRVCNSHFIMMLDLFLSSLERETRGKKVDTSKLNICLKWLGPNVSFQSSILSTYCIQDMYSSLKSVLLTTFNSIQPVLELHNYYNLPFACRKECRARVS